MKQTAGRKQLTGVADKFAELNDDILFGEVWSRTGRLSLKTRCIITVVSLIAKGITDNSLTYHLTNAKNNGVSLDEMAEIITHIAFYVGWPNAWAVLPRLKEIYGDDDKSKPLFGLGEENKAYQKYFIGKSYLKMLNTQGVMIANVTFSPRCRNNYHIHHKGGQILVCVDGEGIYQEEGKAPRHLRPGDIVYIAPEVKHWHGAKGNCYFSHLAIEIPAEGASNEWLEPVDDKSYDEADFLTNEE